MPRMLECECGFGAWGEDDDQLVAAAQTHARLVHHLNLPADLILARAAQVDGAPPRNAETRRPPPGGPSGRRQRR